MQRVALRQDGEGLQPAAFTQQLREVGEAVRPSQNGVVVVTARGEVMQPGEGGNLRRTRAVIIAAAVIEVPQQRWRAVAFTRQPGGEGEVVERTPFRILRGEGDGNGENLAPVAAARAFQPLDEGEKAAAVAILLRQQRLLPAPAKTQPFRRGIDQIRLAVAWRVAICTACKDAEVGEHFAHRDAFPRRQSKIMRATWRAQIAADEGGVVAVALNPFGKQHVAQPLPCQIPQRGQRRRTAAEDEDIAIADTRRLRPGKGSVAQLVAERQADAAHRQRWRSVEVAVGQPRRGCGDADGGGLDEKTAAIVHTDIIIRRER